MSMNYGPKLDTFLTSAPRETSDSIQQGADVLGSGEN